MSLKGAATPLFILLLLACIGLLAWQNDILIASNATAEARIEKLTTELEEEKAALTATKAASDEQSARLIQAEETVAQLRSRQQAKVVKIYTEAVPGDCDGAVRWAAVQGQEKGRSWAVQ